jgi:ribosomal protein L11 methylase PrmA
MSGPLVDAGSFRDPSGRVYKVGNEIFRTVSPQAAEHYSFVKGTGLLDDLVKRGLAVSSDEVDCSALGEAASEAQMVLRHSRIPFISYPYEWPFALLKAAALLHLEIQIEALERGVVLSDASAYNIQFVGPKPQFIDILSFRRYEEGELWRGHRQFCEQFLNPLLLRALFGIPHNAWFRGRLEGIETESIAELLPWWRKFSLNLATHVTLPARLQRKATANSADIVAKARLASLPKRSYLGMLRQLQGWIGKLEPRDTGTTVWRDYDTTNTYASDEEAAKRAFIGEFASKVKPAMMWDLGCNSGEYSEVALQNGAERVVGFDIDQGALERSYARASAKSLDLLPLYQDAANPSPSQGWNVAERPSVSARGGAAAITALAFEHHLAIARNIPLDQVVSWLVSLAPQGVIEFVQKSDPTVQQLLSLREDIFDAYTQDAFEAALGGKARIVKSERVAATGRTLYWFDRS